MKPTDRILLAHGGGGRLTQDLVRETFLPPLSNPVLASLTDAALLPELPPGRVALTTDGFVVDPPEFPGGDLGYLSVCGTVNDLAAVGARPLYLTWALILEEGTERALVERLTAGAARAAEEAGVCIVAGDTKVVPRGKADRVFAVTAGLGVAPPGRDLGDHRIQPGDAILSTGPLGDHGAAILALRHGIQGPRSDCAPLASLADHLLTAGLGVRVLHDPTRGGLRVTCHEVATRTGLRIRLQEAEVPVSSATATLCDLLGLEPFDLACEGRYLLWVAPEDAETALERLREHPAGAGAAILGQMEPAAPGEAPLVLKTPFGSERPLDLRESLDLPRIC